jgi:hypothetical protein
LIMMSVHEHAHPGISMRSEATLSSAMSGRGSAVSW